MDDKDRTDQIRETVRNRYGQIATSGGGCGCSESSCCGAPVTTPESHSTAMGYSADEIRAVPEGSNMGLGCGNPSAIAALRPGEVVLDLGSGGGFDAFLAARQVGEAGRVIGVDMTPEMVGRAREEAKKSGTTNVEFRLGEIESLPAEDRSIDVIISNCVINLSPEKRKVFREAFRVLKPGGRLAVSDIIASAPLPEAMKKDLNLVAGCIAGAATRDEIEGMLRDEGFQDIRILPSEESRTFIRNWVPGTNAQDYVVSATIEAIKPAGAEIPDRRTGAEPGGFDGKAIRKKAYTYFESGFHCAEVVSKTILDAFSAESSTGPIRCASGFGGGIAGSMEEVCGAFTGGVIALGALLGRDKPDESLKECAVLIARFKSRFLEEFGRLHCPEITRGFREEKNPLGCVKLTGKTAEILAGLLKEYEARNGVDLRACSELPRERIGEGCCAFSGKALTPRQSTECAAGAS